MTPDATGVTIRPGTADDLPAIVQIYNHYIRETAITFDLEPFTVDQRREWLSHYGPDGRHRILVAARGDQVLGYATSGRWRPKAAYDPSVETSIYLDAAATGRGIGTALYAALFDALQGQDVHRAYAGISGPNPASVALHDRFGFHRVGTFTQQGRKFGRWWDVTWYEKPL